MKTLKREAEELLMATQSLLTNLKIDATAAEVVVVGVDSEKIKQETVDRMYQRYLELERFYDTYHGMEELVEDLKKCLI